MIYHEEQKACVRAVNSGNYIHVFLHLLCLSYNLQKNRNITMLVWYDDSHFLSLAEMLYYQLLCYQVDIALLVKIYDLSF